MKKKMFFGLSTAAMLLYAPMASAYWTGHAEVIKEMVWAWIDDHASTEPLDGGRSMQKEAGQQQEHLRSGARDMQRVAPQHPPQRQR